MAAKPVKLKGKIKNGIAEMKALMPHPMETGTRRDSSGNLIQAHFIESVTCEHNGVVALKADWGASVSKNPYFAFKILNASSGDKVRVSWIDNKCETSDAEITLK